MPAKEKRSDFGIVMNIENFYSIGVVEEEMKEAIFFYRSQERGEEIANEEFRVIDEARGFLELFTKLNDSLMANWNIMYQFAKSITKRTSTWTFPDGISPRRGSDLSCRWKGLNWRLGLPPVTRP